MLQTSPLLVAGDLLALAMVVIVGFISHGEADVAFVHRALASYVPLAGGWLCMAVLLRLFDRQARPYAAYFGRVLVGALVSAVVAVIVRSWILGTPVQIPFLLVLAVTSALALLIWRGVYAKFRR